MSPEQARGCDDVDYRADIWSVCVVLYEAISGRTPFSAPNYNALLRAFVEDEPESLLDYAAGEAELWEIVKQGLAKARDERPRSMAELGRALTRWLLSQGTHEDACGTSVESKWLGHSSDPLSLLDRGPEPSPVNAAISPNLAGGLRAELSSLESRGPFTATIRPERGKRKGRSQGEQGTGLGWQVSGKPVPMIGRISRKSASLASPPPYSKPLTQHKVSSCIS